MQTYVPSTLPTDVNTDSKHNGNSSPTANISTDDNEKNTTARTESSIDENKLEQTSNEQKPPSLLSNDITIPSQQNNVEHQTDRRRDLTSV
jgi:hypothetical protein